MMVVRIVGRALAAGPREMKIQLNRFGEESSWIVWAALNSGQECDRKEGA